MITPLFKLDQEDDFLIITIRVPYAQINEVDVFIENNDFRFYCKPYYLRLNLPGNIIDDETAGTYDFEAKSFKFKYEKETKGQKFDGLDLITKLLTPCTKPSDKLETEKKATGPLIEEINPEEEEEDVNYQETAEDEGDIWYVEQNKNTQDTEETETIKINSIDSIKYGFAQTKSNIFSKLSSEYLLIIDLPDPDSTSQEQRTQLRYEQEMEKFDDDHYLADTFDNKEMIDDIILKYEEAESEETIDYTEKEMDCLKALPKKNLFTGEGAKILCL